VVPTGVLWYISCHFFLLVHSANRDNHFSASYRTLARTIPDELAVHRHRYRWRDAHELRRFVLFVLAKPREPRCSKSTESRDISIPDELAVPLIPAEMQDHRMKSQYKNQKIPAVSEPQII
jgi:hypothetical protein